MRRGLGEGEGSFVGFRYGWAGVLDPSVVELTRASTAGILPRGGTILGTSRTNPLDGRPGGMERINDTFELEKLDALIPIGGEDTLGVALRLAREGLPIVGVPKTIDNDIGGTDVTFGFHTAVQIATEAIDRLHTTAESHNRVMVVEVMGRHAGWIATYAGIAGGADAILVPERPFDIEELCARLRRRHASGITFSIVVVSEGATPREGGAMTLADEHTTDEFGHVRLGGSASSSPTSWRRSRGMRRARRPSGTCSAGGRRPPMTACWPRALVSRRWMRRRLGTSARWWPCGAPTSSRWGWTRRWPSPSCSTRVSSDS